MGIDKNAPLIAKKEIIIAAPLDRVWAIQSSIEAWPTWQKDITTATLNGPLQKGTTFQWKAMGMHITSQLIIVEKNAAIGWTGVSMGMQAVHIWKFKKQKDKTVVQTEESLSGWFARLLKFFNKNFLETSLTKSLETLKAHAELSGK